MLRGRRHEPAEPGLHEPSGLEADHQIAWSPDGSKILVLGVKNGTNGQVFGLIEFVSNVPLSTQASFGARARS